jgi:5-methylcytosine-specific restriction endonuclease McrA
VTAGQRRNYLRNIETRRANARQYAKDNPEKNCEQSRRWLAAHREYGRDQNQKYRERYPERIKAARTKARATPEYKAAKAQYYREHAIQTKENVQLWQQANPEKVRSYSRTSSRKRRARKLAIPEVWTAEMESLVYEHFDYRCAVCQLKTAETQRSFHVDHWYPLSLGFPLTLANAVLMCPSCNCAKGAKLPEAIYQPEVVAYIEAKLGVFL